MNRMAHAKGGTRRPVWEGMSATFCGVNRILLGVVCGVKRGRMSAKGASAYGRNPTVTNFFFKVGFGAYAHMSWEH